jgi:sterol desaturase/sphingolipid hydroxylase (fatty acid hydroxylase superfamily)
MLPAFATLALGLLLFSLVEYLFHRYVFHGPVALFARGHLTHHVQPLAYESLPFFLPPLLVLGIARALAAVMPVTYALLVAGATATGYACYGLAHTVIHHIRFRSSLGRRWAASHHVHHRHLEANYGVTTPLWDFVFGTRYRSRQAAGID